MNLADLDLLPNTAMAFDLAIGRDHGLVLVTGRTGTGKTDTARVLLGLAGVGRTVVRLSELDQHAPLGAAHVLDVGDIRSEDTARRAVESSLQSLVVGVLRSGQSRRVVARLLSMDVPAEHLSQSNPVVFTQDLCGRLCASCRVPTLASRSALAAVGLDAGALDATAGHTFEARGCDQCVAGYRGKVTIFEALVLHLAPDGAIQAEDLKARMYHDAAIKLMAGITSLDQLRDVDLFPLF